MMIEPQGGAGLAAAAHRPSAPEDPFEAALQRLAGRMGGGKADASRPRDARVCGGPHTQHLGFDAPAGLMYTHLMPAGSWMVDYHLVRSLQAGNMRSAAGPASVQQVLDQCSQPFPGDASPSCLWLPTRMRMSMHMLDLMYAPSDTLTLMLMPQFMDMSMAMRSLGADGGFTHYQVSPAHSMDMSVMDNAGLGDTTLAALVGLGGDGRGETHLGLGLSVPTGSVDKRMNMAYSPSQTPYLITTGELLEPGMQTGSGTWDFLPSLTHNAQSGRWRWGGQLSAIRRLQSRNAAGWRLGHQAQASLWGGLQWAEGLASTLRWTASQQGAAQGVVRAVSWTGVSVDANGLPSGDDTPASRTRFSPTDILANYGGRFQDLGIGLTASLGASHQVALEWTRPLRDRPNGYQLERKPGLALTWRSVLQPAGAPLDLQLPAGVDAYALAGLPAPALTTGSADGAAKPASSQAQVAGRERPLGDALGRAGDRLAELGGLLDQQAPRGSYLGRGAALPTRASAAWGVGDGAGLGLGAAEQAQGHLAGFMPVSLGSAGHAGPLPQAVRFASGEATLTSARVRAGLGLVAGRGSSLALEAQRAGSELAIGLRASDARARDARDVDGRTLAATGWSRREEQLMVAGKAAGGQLSLALGAEQTPEQGRPDRFQDLTDGRGSHVDLGYLRPIPGGLLMASIYQHRLRQELGLLADKAALGWVLPQREQDGRERGWHVQARLATGGEGVLRLGHEWQQQRIEDGMAPVAGVEALGPHRLLELHDARQTRTALYADWPAASAGGHASQLGLRVEQVASRMGRVQGFTEEAFDLAGGPIYYAFDAGVANTVDNRRADTNVDLVAAQRWRFSPVSEASLGYARRSRSPSLHERYTWMSEMAMAGALNGSNGNAWVGNGDLRPEVAHTLRAELDLHDPARAHGGAWRVRLAPYLSQIQDWIGVEAYPDYNFPARTPAPSGRLALRSVNHDARILGLDLQTEQRLFGDASDDWRAGAGLQLQRARDLSEGRSLAGHPPRVLRLALDHHTPAWQQRIEWVAVGGQAGVPLRTANTDASTNQTLLLEPAVAAYRLVNVRLAYRWQGLTVDLGVENLLNRRHDLAGVDLARYNFDASQVAARQAPGRAMHLGLTLDF